MFSVLPSFIVYPLHLTLQMLSLAFWAINIILLGFIKFLLPFSFVSKPINIVLNFMMCAFGFCSVTLIKMMNKVEFDYVVDGQLSQKEWYLIISNHLSWLDIILLTDFAAGKIPAPKFFLKKELIWLPFVGLGAWALDMPFMQRYNKAFLQKNPHLRGKDIATTKKSCEKFRQLPTTVINFVEGNRFTPEKQKLKQGPFTNLLPPKAGGIAFTLATMGELFTSVLDITVIYPDTKGSPMHAMLSGRLKRVIVRVNVHPVTDEIVGDYFNDENFKQGFQSWLNSVWHNKDKLISELKETN
ncbi:acyltransferase [Paraglaciecola arctica]|uniref:acyltransferase n=1 Tax=Paraglaciecola arctica TaxID=1128911 RepID=UPI001C07E09C|nr:acyltransferase [Paraglaciecola arctica]MBU3005127.1 acyltransferase [Paraglaciecola arctica]